jgi:DNA-binding XRE family transcriptional regulator
VGVRNPGGDSEVLWQMRRALGRQLAALRNRSGFSQWELAPLTGYSRSTLSDAELGRHRLRREFWLRCDELLSAEGGLAGSYDRIETTAALIRQRVLSTAQVARDQRASARLRSVRPLVPAEADDRGPVRGPGPAGSPLASQTCPHCHQRITVVMVAAAPAADRRRR